MLGSKGEASDGEAARCGRAALQIPEAMARCMAG